jgi:capsule polysaccharide modification protein KpsS
MPRDPEFYRSLDLPEPEPPIPVGNSFGLGAWYSTLNALAFTHLNHGFPHYVHHRNLNAWFQTFAWVRSYVRKKVFEIRERGWIDRFAGELAGRYFFVPLQVHCDFQLVHSPYDDVTDFVKEVLDVFAEHAAPEHAIVFKHHPMDRPYRDYTRWFRQLEKSYGLEGRLFYVHDLHLPTLLKHARGTITINSTVGLSSIHHRTPVKVMGTAVYDMPGLTFQGSLAEFLKSPGAPDMDLYERFRRYLLHTNQANGNIFKRLPGYTRGTGVRWFGQRTASSSDTRSAT